jgi:hypothetical protein
MSSASTSLFQNFGRGNSSGSANTWPNPWADHATYQMPRSLYDVLRWCEFIYMTNGTYRMAMQRIVRYFLTRVELVNVSDDERDKYTKFLNDVLRIMDVLAKSGDDFMCYGNAFVSFVVPFRRHLACKKKGCGQERPIDDWNYRFQDYKFFGTCQRCGYKGELRRVDRRSIEQDQLRVQTWSPHEIRILNHPVSHDVEYLWDPPSDLKKNIKQGHPFYLRTMPWEMIEAIANNQLFKFSKGVVYHIKESTLSGIRNGGWGIPRILANFRQAYYVQVLRRYNEAIGLDYIVPFRVLTPGTRPGGQDMDPMLNVGGQQFMSQVMGMLRRHRRDPAQWNALPFPLDYQALGGEAKNLAPVELIDHGTKEFLNAVGVPAEMYEGNLTAQAAPTALRLFERTWTHFVSAINGLLKWMFDQISSLMNWEDVSGKLQSVTLADDIEKKQILLQLASAQQISRSTAYQPFGIDWKDEVERMLEEEDFFQESSARYQKEQAKKQEMEQRFEAASQAQQMPPGGMPMDPAMMGAGGAAPMGPTPTMPMSPMGAAPAGGGGVTPDDMAQQAEQVAIQMLGMPYEARKSQLLNLKKQNETLHAVVIQKMQTIRSQAQREGGFQQLQQMVGAGAG